MKRKYYIILILIISLIVIQTSKANFDEGIEKIKEGDYPNAIILIKEACPNLKTDYYNETILRCNFNLAFAYENLASITINGERVGYLKIDKSLLEQVIYYYENAINISKLKIDSVQISDALPLANIMVAIVILIMQK